MAATVQIISAHGATITTTETPIDGATIKYKRADNDTNNASNPVPVPSSGNKYSWRKTMRIKATTTPDGEISNLRWFSDGGSWGTGVKLWAHDVPVANYTQGAVADETTKIPQDAGEGAVTDASTYTSGAPLTLNSGTVIANPSTGYGTQNAVESQIEVGTTATRGSKGPRTFTMRLDES